MNERRGLDVGPPDGVERRKRGRPPMKPEDRQQTVTFHVKLPVLLADQVYLASVRQGRKANAILRALVEKAALAGEW